MNTTIKISLRAPRRTFSATEGSRSLRGRRMGIAIIAASMDITKRIAGKRVVERKARNRRRRGKRRRKRAKTKIRTSPKERSKQQVPKQVTMRLLGWP